MEKQIYTHTQFWFPKAILFKHTGKTRQLFKAVLWCLTFGIRLTHLTWTLGLWDNSQLDRELDFWHSPSMDASTIMLLPYVPFLRLKIGRKKGGGRGRDAASVPSCSRGINEGYPWAAGDKHLQRFSSKNVAAALCYRHQSGSWRGHKDSTVLMLWTSLLNCTLLSYIHF